MKFAKKIIPLLISVLVIFTLTSCSEETSDETTTEENITESAQESTEAAPTEENTEAEVKEFGDLGSATEMDGTTVLLSVFIDDSNYSWNFDNSEDIDTAYDMLNYTTIACDWLKENTARYNCNFNCIYDWNADENLFYEAQVTGDLLSDEESDGIAWDYIENNIDSEAILEQYDADNIVYIFFINTPSSIDTTSCTRNYYDGMEYPYEICYMYCHCDGSEECPAAIAHEILHTFGAPDLYYADYDGDNYGITQEFVDELSYEESNDIMFVTFDCYTNELYYDHISNDFTDLDAYYVGLTDSNETVDEWGFYESEHIR